MGSAFHAGRAAVSRNLRGRPCARVQSRERRRVQMSNPRLICKRKECTVPPDDTVRPPTAQPCVDGMHFRLRPYAGGRPGATVCEVAVARR